MKKIIAIAILSLGIVAYSDAPQDYGWQAPAQKALFSDPPAVPSKRGAVRLLYKDWEKATGYSYNPRNQSAPDCVGHATAAALDFRMATQSLEGPYLIPQRETDASSIYGLSRVEISQTKWSSGSTCRWGAQAVQQYGLLFRKNYIYAGYDLTRYNPDLSRKWGKDGLPDVLEKIAKITPVTEYYQVRSYEEIRDAIAAGYPVIVGSDIGFSRRTFFAWGRTKATRDRDGFLRRRGVWKHAMCFCGVDDRSSRKGVCCINSWGRNWISGPRKLDQPAGSFWIDARTVTLMARQGDAFAIVQVQAPLNYELAEYELFKDVKANRLIVITEPSWCAPCKRLEPHLEELRKKGFEVYTFTTKEWNKAKPKPTNLPQPKSVPTVMYVLARNKTNRVIKYHGGGNKITAEYMSQFLIKQRPR